MRHPRGREDLLAPVNRATDSRNRSLEPAPVAHSMAASCRSASRTNGRLRESAAAKSALVDDCREVLGRACQSEGSLSRRASDFSWRRSFRLSAGQPVDSFWRLAGAKWHVANRMVRTAHAMSCCSRLRHHSPRRSLRVLVLILHARPTSRSAKSRRHSSAGGPVRFCLARPAAIFGATSTSSTRAPRRARPALAISKITCCASSELKAFRNPARSTLGHTAATAAASRSL